MHARVVREPGAVRAPETLRRGGREKRCLRRRAGRQPQPRRRLRAGLPLARAPGRMRRLVDRHDGRRRVAADVEDDLEAAVGLALPDREEHAVPVRLAVAAGEDERSRVPAEVAGRGDVAVDGRPVRAHRRRRRRLAGERDAHAKRMRIEGDAVVREVRVERIAEALLGREPHEGALGVEQFLLRRRQAGVGGERRVQGAGRTMRGRLSWADYRHGDGEAGRLPPAADPGSIRDFGIG